MSFDSASHTFLEVPSHLEVNVIESKARDQIGGALFPLWGSQTWGTMKDSEVSYREECTLHWLLPVCSKLLDSGIFCWLVVFVNVLP